VADKGPNEMMHLLLAGLALLVVLAALTAVYFLYSPTPKPPQLKGSLTKEVLDVQGRSRTYQAVVFPLLAEKRNFVDDYYLN
jgi:hypothetical protein